MQILKGDLFCINQIPFPYEELQDGKHGKAKRESKGQTQEDHDEYKMLPRQRCIEIPTPPPPMQEITSACQKRDQSSWIEQHADGFINNNSSSEIYLDLGTTNGWNQIAIYGSK